MEVFSIQLKKPFLSLSDKWYWSVEGVRNVSNVFWYNPSDQAAYLESGDKLVEGIHKKTCSNPRKRARILSELDLPHRHIDPGW